MLKLAGICSGAASAMLLGGCATTYTTDDTTPAATAERCDASSVQSNVGAKATAKLAARLIEQTGSRTLRWLPPRTAMTMDYRQDRLNIGYDDNYVIERIMCG
ncbi:I78 family peptidase inhibitor [Tsuneonella flava]|uniref:I78 family peptidase inhibitor n=1 Tax=Tsuneonella flava TaxID=2055955 RepID=UPI001EEE042C|nr:I78 family peptidase inhibitor [Tsuneonella flava]